MQVLWAITLSASLIFVIQTVMTFLGLGDHDADIVSVIVGILLVTVVMWIFKWLSGMQQTGNIDVHKSAVGCEGKVYLTIPGERKGEGKVQITINNAVREYDAVTDGETIPTGKAIKVTEVINDYTLLVEELTPTII